MVAATADGLRALILEQQYRPGAVLDSEHRLSELLGVSRGTVRLAIETLVATGEITRQPHSRPLIGMADGRSSNKTGLDVYVWVSHPIADEATLMFMKGISRGLSGTQYQMVVREPTRFFGDFVKSDERQFLTDLLSNDQVAGTIVNRDPCATNEDIFAQLLRAGKHLVFVDCPPPKGISADYVGTANVAAARRLVEHLIDLGHRRILCLVDLDSPQPTQDRIKGYWRAMTQAGLADFGGCLVAGSLDSSGLPLLRPGGEYVKRLTKSSVYIEWAHRLVQRVLSMDKRPTALFVGCDVLAFSVCAYLEGAGLRIPEDMSVVGFDWLARWDVSHPDTLDSAGQDFEGFGKHAADLLLDRITGEDLSTPRHVLLDAPLVVRSSTAPELSTLTPLQSETARSLLDP